jgi:heme exporter protein CcmD
MAHLHTTFITAAYCFAAFVIFALLAWIALDHRAQQKKLSGLEARRAKKS